MTYLTKFDINAINDALSWSSNAILPALPSLVIILLGVVGGYIFYQIVYTRMERGRQRNLILGFGLVLFTLFTGLLTVVALPVPDEAQNQIIKIGGLVITAIVAFSSTTLIRDTAAGIALQFTTAYERGDYLKINGHFGRVTEIGVLHTEIQTQERSLVNIANGMLMSETFETYPSSGPLLTVEVGLGYNNVRQEIEEALKEAAHVAGLKQPFVHIDSLDDYTVQYAVSAVLENGEQFLSKRSDFRKVVLDTLHEHGIEIMSPQYSNLRHMDENDNTIPEVRRYEHENDTDVEDVVFEKAIKAQDLDELEKMEADLKERREQVNDRNLDEEIKENRLGQIDKRIDRIKKQKASLEEELDDEE